MDNLRPKSILTAKCDLSSANNVVEHEFIENMCLEHVLCNIYSYVW